MRETTHRSGTLARPSSEPASRSASQAAALEQPAAELVAIRRVVADWSMEQSRRLAAIERGRLSGQAASEARPAPTAPAPAPTPPVPAPAPPADGLTITSSTFSPAPSGAPDSRYIIGIGEKVTFKGPEKGTWTATGGTPTSADASDEFVWDAPDKPGQWTITQKIGDKTGSKSMAVIAPSSIQFKRASVQSFPPGKAGAGMDLDITIGPSHVSFGDTKIKEIGGKAHSVSGFFAKIKDGTDHEPRAGWTDITASNEGDRQDAAHAGPFGGPDDPAFEPGSMSWDIPHNYSVDGTGDGTGLAIVRQTMSMVDSTGTMTVTKGGQSVTRKPSDP